MERKLSVVEHIVFKKYRNYRTQLVFSMNIQGQFSEEDLKRAVSKLRKKHPLLSKRVEEKNEWSYFVDDHIEELPIRIVNRTGNHQWIDEEKKELLTSFDVCKGPLSRVVWIKGNDQSEIIFSIHHLIADGRAVAFVMKDLFYCIANRDYKLETYPFLPGILKLIPDGTFNSSEKDALRLLAEERAKTIIKTYEKVVPDTVSDKDNSTVLHWTLKTKDTKLLLKKIKEHNVSLQSTMHIAFLEAYDKTLGKAACPNIVKVPADIRRKLKRVLTSDMMGTSFATPLHINFSYKRRGKFWDMAHQVQLLLKAQALLKDLYKEIVILEYMKPYISKLIPRFFNINKENKSELSMTNLGILRINNVIGKLKMTSFSAAGSVMGNHNILGLVLFDNRLKITLITSNESMNTEQAIELQQHMMESLNKHIGQPLELVDGLRYSN